MWEEVADVCTRISQGSEDAEATEKVSKLEQQIGVVREADMDTLELTAERTEYI